MRVEQPEGLKTQAAVAAIVAPKTAIRVAV